MEFQYYGGNCIRITTKNATFIVDDTLEALGQKSITKADAVSLYTGQQEKYPEARLRISDPGEYEVSEVSIFGIAARGHMDPASGSGSRVDEAGQKSATIYKLLLDDTRVCILGHVYPDLTEDQLEEIGTVDILVVPVGGNGYTTDGVGALSLIKKIEPKIVIPTHYEDKGLTYEVPQQPLSEALKGLGMEPKETVAKYKFKPTDLSETVQLIVLERQ